MKLNFHSIVARIGTAFAVFTALFIAVVIGLLLGVHSVTGESQRLEQDLNARTRAVSTMYRTGLLAGIATRNKIFNPTLTMAPKVVARADREFDAALAKLRTLTPSADTKTAAALTDIDSRWKQVKQVRQDVLALAEQRKVDDAAKQLAKVENPAWRAIRIRLDELLADHNATAAAGRAKMSDDIRALRTNAVIASGIAVLIGLVLVILIIRTVRRGLTNVVERMRDIAEGDGDLTLRLDASGKDEFAQLGAAFNTFVDKIRQLVGQVAGSSTQLAAAAEQLSAIGTQSREGIERQHRETDSVATAVNEMAATVQEVARNTADAAQLAHTADSDAASGQKAVDDTVANIRALNDEFQGAARVISELESQSENIGSVLDVIRGVAEQTNLLALNAAIEAARAGEHGRGFAVVASEVRILANRTQDSTTEIHEMIAQLQERARRAVSVMESSQRVAEQTAVSAGSAGEKLGAIAKQVTQISDMNTQIASAAEEQSAVAEEINRNVVSIRGIASEAAQSANQASAASAELARLANSLNGLMGGFRV